MSHQQLITGSIASRCGGPARSVQPQTLTAKPSGPVHSNYDIITATINATVADIRLSYYVEGCPDAPSAGFYTLKAG